MHKFISINIHLIGRYCGQRWILQKNGEVHLAVITGGASVLNIIMIFGDIVKYCLFSAEAAAAITCVMQYIQNIFINLCNATKFAKIP